MNTVAVIDYGMGNLRSVCKAIEHVAPGARVQLTAAAADIRHDDRVVFPGQGAIGGCMAALETGMLRESLLESMKTKPFFGICLGLQALYDFSEEGGGTPCLSLLAGAGKRFPPEKMKDTASGLPPKGPHMGWNQERQTVAPPL